MKRLLIVVFFFLSVSMAFAQGRLSPAQIERVKVFKNVIASVDKKTLLKTISELEKAGDPQFAIQIQEIIAKVYAEIVQEKVVTDQANKEWLYGMVALNMANLQFGGRADDAVSRLIVQKLQKNLPADVLSHPDFYVSVE